ncbi:MAG: DUF547 domain-containing protein [Saprospiraceae bacterium]
MKKTALFALSVFGVLVIWFTCANCRAIKHSSDSAPVSHELWNTLLRKHVDEQGWVDYKGFRQDSTELNRYLSLLESSHPDDKSWSRNEQMAYWINAYNAYTVKLIVQHYPVASIKDIKKGVAFVNSVWDIKWIKIGGYTYDLNNIEHNILRPVFKDARVHAAVNCASYSCPKLRAEAYTAEKLDKQLEDAMRTFVNDPLRNQVTADNPRVSEIFKWFGGDFSDNAGSVKAFINKYAAQKMTENASLTYIDYDWRLNEKP